MARHSRSTSAACWAILRRRYPEIRPGAFPMLEPVEERHNVGATQHRGVHTLIRTMQAQAVAQHPDAVDVVPQHADDVGSSAQRQLLEHPLFDRVAKPRLVDHREIQAFTAVAENAHIPNVFVLLGFRSATSRQRVLQLLSEPTDMAWQSCDVDVGDAHHARTAQVTGEDAQLIQVGDHAASTPFLQAKQNLGLHRRRQSPHDERMTARDRGGRSAPCVEIGHHAFAVLIPPPRVVRSAQPTQVPCLPVANRNPAYTKSWERLRCRVVHKLRSRQVQPFPVIIVNLAQHDAVVPTRAGTIANRADDLTPPKLAHRPRGRELLDRHPRKSVSLPARHAEPVRNPRFASASLHTATPKPQQRMIRRWCQCFGFRVPPGGGEKLRVQSRPRVLGRTFGSTVADRRQHRAHRPSPLAGAHAATRSTASRNLCGEEMVTSDIQTV